MFNPIRHTEGLNNSMRCKLSKIVPRLAIFYPKIYVLYSGMISHGHSKCGMSVFDIMAMWQWSEIWKWNGTIVDLIDMREKSKNVLYKKVKNFVL
jgi:hypothetical protein